jgi:hypothetical protein
MRVTSSVFLLFVGLVLSVPLIGTAYRVVSGTEVSISKAERRHLATISAMVRDVPLTHFRDFATRLGEAFKDQLYLRQEITAAVNRTLIFGFGHSPTDAVHLGSNGYWFQADAISCAADGGVNMARAAAMIDSFKQFRTRASEAGTKAYAIAVPLSATLFPENLKEPFKSRCLTSDSSNVLTNLASGTEGFAYDLDWFSAQPEKTIYSPKSFHWGRGGASRYLNHLLTDGMLAGQRRVVALGKERIRVRNIDNASDLGVAPLASPQVDFSLAEPPKRSFNGRELSPELADRLGNIVKRLEALLVSEGGQQPGVGVLVGDSFTAAIWPYFSRHFETAYRFQTASMKLRPGVLDEIVEALKPDYMLIVLTETKWLITDPSTKASGFERMLLPPPGITKSSAR